VILECRTKKCGLIFFNPSEILKEMEVDNSIHTLLDIGCGYGTFLIPESNTVKSKSSWN
jgi:tRNA G46 methylase TrmB